jgi:ribosomal protein L40E
MIRKCVQCWKESPIEATHCIHCGESLGSVKCRSCNDWSPLGAESCISCGSKLESEIEREEEALTTEYPTVSPEIDRESGKKFEGDDTRTENILLGFFKSRKPMEILIFVLRWILLIPGFVLSGFLTNTLYHISWGQISSVGYDIKEYGSLGGHWIEGPIFIFGVSVAIIVVPAFVAVYIAPVLKRTVLTIAILFFCLTLVNLLVTGYSMYGLANSLWSENALTVSRQSNSDKIA